MQTISNNHESKTARLLKNKTMLGIIAGLISGLLKDIIDLITYSLKITDNLFGYLASGIFVDPKTARSASGLIVGYLADFIMDGFLGLVFVYFIKNTEPDYILSKSIGFGLSLWIFILGAVGAFKITTLPVQNPMTVLTMFFTHAFFGLVIGLIVKKYGKAAFNHQQTT